MQPSKCLWLIASLAVAAVAQDSSECDPQNDSNNDATCTSSAVSATMTGSSSASNTNTDTTTQTSTATTTVAVVSTDTANSRVSSYYVTSTQIGPVITTDVVSSLVVTTNPKSMYVQSRRYANIDQRVK